MKDIHHPDDEPPVDPFILSATSVYPPDAIVNYPEDAEMDEHGSIFLRGPFEDIPVDRQVDPLLEEVDYGPEPCTYHTIVSCGGRIAYGTGENELLGNEILSLAAQGGWDEAESYQEIWYGGADVLPDYMTRSIADGLLNLLGRTDSDFDYDGRRVSRELVWKAYIVYGAGPTIVPW